MTAQDQAHVTDLLPAYALDCLDEGDAERVAAHLAGCTACQEELRAYQAVTDRLALAAPDATPPPRVKQALLARAAPRPAAGRRPARPSWQASLGRLSSRLVPAWGAVSLVLVAALAASTLWLWGQAHPSGVLPTPEAMSVVRLTGTAAAPLATGTLIISMDGVEGTLVVDRLPPLAQDRQYQLWLTKDGTRASGGVFSVPPEGYASFEVYAPDPLSSYTSFGITVEPSGGSPGPTGEKVLGGGL